MDSLISEIREEVFGNGEDFKKCSKTTKTIVLICYGVFVFLSGVWLGGSGGVCCILCGKVHPGCDCRG